LATRIGSPESNPLQKTPHIARPRANIARCFRVVAELVEYPDEPLGSLASYLEVGQPSLQFAATNNEVAVLLELLYEGSDLSSSERVADGA
jgi:hypothetical protein